MAARAFGTVSFGATPYHARSIRPSTSTRNDDRMIRTEVRPSLVFLVPGSPRLGHRVVLPVVPQVA